ncbi:nitrate/sulfonate/bicarbonate ABC transporter ATP-binding protein [Mycolicibacterium agri]|uniref:Nitrate/sulfonate/bicarbonate ABC transporter ATP-binding protein n=1 Tax=Mycolicibacterium agri TaxID=36811 RepID=A0A2A7MVA7_MYCAG|nr:ABC transporter ATP-binding protein [Mycolicibacterium agri]PEG35437.1 nitrate/sulfonate/bicarbonate ABC transporter ATP-binding protein [Mycolicibacterium agri]GFG55564.1 nitrate/sulfonate/bicarbonate ABC transporter ATP-binding protein [Mycolicibacterium agri]
MAVLKAHKVTKEFPPTTKDQPVVRALDGIDFEMSGQSFVSMVGPSGCGKSTFLNIVSGVETPTTGSVDVTADGGGAARLGYVFQDPRLLPWLTVTDNLIYVQPKANKKLEYVQPYLDLVGLTGFEHMYPAHLSGGMQQRVGIARAFSVEPDLLLMDEPFSHLDAITARGMRAELQRIWARTKRTVLFITHDVIEAVQLSDRIIILEVGGRIYADIEVGLSYPRLQTDPAVATLQSEILQVFEEMESRRASKDPRIAAKAGGESTTA